jgi:catechol 2,3-dioxygenase-like lactoylglutathione lyase family enzyme
MVFGMLIEEKIMLGKAKVAPTIPAKDMKRAQNFYGETLGLKELKSSSEGTVYESGSGTNLFLYPSAGAGTSQATYAAWEVDDLEAEMKTLRDKGVKFEDYDMPGLKTENGIASYEGGKGAWFKDSEGNILALDEGMGTS